jgi:hypothetical protein
MPKIEVQPIGADAALTSVAASIALQEAGLAHIINAEGEKISYFVDPCNEFSLSQILEINDSVHRTLASVSSIETILVKKLRTALDAISPNADDEAAENIPEVSAAYANIPGASIQARRLNINGVDDYWLCAHIYGKPLPGDRLYLRRQIYNKSDKSDEKADRRRMVHPMNPEGECGGNLQPHVRGSYLHRVAADENNALGNADKSNGARSFLRTEWTLSKPNEEIRLLPVAPFIYFFNKKGGTHNRYIILDVIVARADEASGTVSFGQPSEKVRFHPVINKRQELLHWSFSFE